jgi:two-component system response regulator NreC
MTTILLADDHVMVRHGLRLFLEQSGFSVVAECGDGLAAVDLVTTLRPDVAILDFGMPLLNGVGAATAILKTPGLDTKIVLLTMHSGGAYVMSSLAAGVHGYVLKSRAPSDLMDAIREVTAGHSFLSPEVSRAVLDTSVTDAPPDAEALSDRELQVLQLVAEGMRTKVIGDVLSISAKTVESHRTRIMQKLNIHETAGLVLYAIRKGVIQP